MDISALGIIVGIAFGIAFGIGLNFMLPKRKRLGATSIASPTPAPALAFTRDYLIERLESGIVYVLHRSVVEQLTKQDSDSWIQASVEDGIAVARWLEDGLGSVVPESVALDD